MDWKVIFSAQASRDLGQVAAFLAQKNPEAAARLGHALVDRALALAQFPKRGVEVKARPGVRRIVHRPWFVIYYRVDETRGVVEIARFWDARQDPRGLRLG